VSPARAPPLRLGVLLLLLLLLLRAKELDQGWRAPCTSWLQVAAAAQLDRLHELV
jgi:hypothetical protein